MGCLQRLFKCRPGLRTRSAFYGAALSSAVVIAMTTVSYIHTWQLVEERESDHLQQAAASIVAPIELTLNTIIRGTTELSKMTLLDSALVDSNGRDAYLRPFLSEHLLPIAIDYNLVLTDFRGIAIAAKSHLRSYDQLSWFTEIMRQGAPYAGVEERNGRTAFLFAIPILYESTGTYEGALVFETDLIAWLGEPKAPVQWRTEFDHIEYHIGSATISAYDLVQNTGPFISVETPIKIDPLTELLPISVHVTISKRAFDRPMANLTRSHFLWGLLAVLIVTLISIWLAKLQTKRIGALAKEARAIAEGKQTFLSLNSGDYGRDEIGGFAQLISSLLIQLRDHQDNLEHQVAHRTAELHISEAALKHAQSLAKIGSFALDISTRRVYGSDEFFHILGISSRNSISLRACLRRVHPDDRHQFIRSWRSTSTGQPLDNTHRVIVADKVKWLNGQYRLNATGDGTTTTYLGTIQDISKRKLAEQALIDSEAYNRGLVQNSKIPLGILDPTSGLFTDCNDATVAVFRCASKEAVIGSTPLTFSPCFQYDGSPSTEAGPEHVALCLKYGDIEFEWQHQGPDGIVWDAEVRLMTFQHLDKTWIQFSLEDITKKRIQDARLQETLVVFNASSQGIMTTDPQGIILSVNPAFCSITGYPADEVVGQNSSILRSGRHDKAFFEQLWLMLDQKGSWEGEIWNRRKNGDSYPQWLSIASVTSDTGQVSEYVSIFSDITDRKRQEEVIWHQANYDALTGLVNRSLMHERLELAMSQARRHQSKVGVLFLDLDGFKLINDTLGHDVGDELLIQVSNRLTTCVREQDTVARLGGDEFTVIINDLHDEDKMGVIADKVVSVLREPFALSGSEYFISGSAGITVFPGDGTTVQTLLRNADIAMYKSKQAGKNCCQFYSQEMQDDAHKRMQLEAAIRTAIKERDFQMFYQPIVDTASGVLTGCEALIRWHHQEHGYMAPGEFIPVAEECGLIIELGEWVLRTALAQLKQWQDEGYRSLRMAINISSLQFSDKNFPDLLRSILSESAVDSRNIVLEMTESMLIDSSEKTEAHMHDIKNTGISYALDDFGTGYSSLSYLKKFPVDIVKIDQRFITDCTSDQSNAQLVKAIVNIAHNLDLHVVAEGVETDQQREFLHSISCDYLQGYLISPAVPPNELQDLLERNADTQPKSGLAEDPEEPTAASFTIVY